MAAPTDLPAPGPPPPESVGPANCGKKLTKKSQVPPSSTAQGHGSEPSLEPSPGSGLRRASRKVVPGLPRMKTFKRQQSEVRERLEPIVPTSAERRAVSVDRRRNVSHSCHPPPRASAPDFPDGTQSVGPQTTLSQTISQPGTPVDGNQNLDIGHLNHLSIDTDHRDITEPPPIHTEAPSSTADVQSTTTSQYDAMIHDELENKWILNLSMHFRDKSKREKFFVTYREKESLWRRVTISLDYRNAPEGSLEKDLVSIRYQRDKSAKIYEAIRESLQDIQFYETVTNLKLQTTKGRLHVHVVEDVNEIIPYPTIHTVQHLRCRRVRESDIQFDSHMSGFVYKVRVNGRSLIKKEIPGPDTVEEFLYEVNALNHLGFSKSVIEFYGVVVDNEDNVKGLLISYAENGALIDVIYDSQGHEPHLPWPTRERWARQIVQGLADIHESGFVQGDFTLSNIVIDHNDDAKIIDINRRGCPVGWEPPEAAPLIDSNQRISMYIGVKSDLYQLGMVLWALATLEDEPEARRRPLRLDPDIEVPTYYRRIVTYCLHENPRVRKQAKDLLAMFPEPVNDVRPEQLEPSTISADYGNRLQEYLVGDFQYSSRPQVMMAEPRNDQSNAGNTQMSTSISEESYYDPPRGRSPPSPLPSHHDTYDVPYINHNAMWSNDIGTYTGMTEPNMKGTSAETPRRTREGMDVAEQFVQDLKSIEASLQDEPANELARATGGESRTAEASRDIVGAHTPMSTTGEPGERGSPVEGDTRTSEHDDRLAAVEVGDSSARHQHPQSKPNNSPTVNQRGTTGSRQSGKRVKGKMKAAARPRDELDEEGETGSGGGNYTHDRREGNPTRTTEAESSPDKEPRSRGSPAGREPNHDLTGVGSAYDKQAEIRQPVCSDEDLGLTPGVAQNLTFMA
ncbi:hypothetical protein DL766_000840 [Monosporascus sp. MC13-8B]|uniref:Protein kinase domain-containing protein n=1 Tax=Monosporascus cannonballus TaxID=155416 RepID=A0ABY0H0C8_9PEZI|nr:hypothetical protein DL762_007022 [Monosporascus cannonballus]RYO94124.1 hypothetical protein DL763_004192 [Monosporascus cannonballus]RYP38630.1 hypothetical protein DL766_000840 [Monosporascus sp. MC13-8B]